MREIIALCAEEIQQIESEIAEVQVLKKKKRPLQKRISVFSPTYWVKYLLVSLLLHFRLFPPKVNYVLPT